MLLLTAFPFLVVIVFIILAIVTRKKVFIVFSIGAIVCEILGRIEKKITKSVSDAKIFQRPNPPAKGCGYFPRDHPRVTFGFPSGHAQFCGFFALFWTLYILFTDWNKNKKAAIIGLIWLAAITVTMDRVYIGCHNILQISVGFVLGLIYGFVAWWLLERKL
jgi:dolichyldiphosphatase